ncbi:MAG: alpha-glucan family phosphorylase [Desulfovibrio sp.]|nr:alpha-glucan family phosphorylase [Desulfovibrio sp.]
MEFNNAPVTLFEVSWEVCNKVGGIYSVVSSKALQAVDTFGEDYFLLGPSLQQNAGFEETDEHIWDSVRIALGARDLKCRLGRWNIPGRPKAILVQFNDRYGSNQLLYDLWKNYGVDSLSGGWDYIEPVMFATACGEVITAIYEAMVRPVHGRAVALFHEWMCGAGLLNIKKTTPGIGTVFTTHATMLGRSLASTGRDIYTNLRNINPAQEAATQNITAKWSMESASARESDAFTTVSQITGEESTYFLGRSPDVITVNGLDMRIIPDYTEQRQVPLSHRSRIMTLANRFLRCQLPSNTRILVISGRYEMHNKGIDVFLDALARASNNLGGANCSVLALLLVMGGHTGVNPAAASGVPNATDNGLPFISSHFVWNAPQDPIISACRRLGLNNQPNNPVKVIFNPAMLDGNDGFFNMQYEDILSACDYGFFPSWYEPWGYTPQESAAWAVPTLTTDLSGFGMWARNEQKNIAQPHGVIVMPRRGMNFDQTAISLHDAVIQAATCEDSALAELRKKAREIAEQTSWSKFFANYLEAFNIALEKAAIRTEQENEARDGMNRVLAASSSVTPFLRPIIAVAELPKELSRLRELAYNLWWCWNDAARSLFVSLNPSLWDKCHNPIQILSMADSERLEQLVANTEYMELYTKVLAEFDAYMAKPLEALSEDLTPEHPIAYFSTEYGLTESVAIYSGGLGVLSGDHLKSASDMRVPLIGIGLLYREGYFKQEIDEHGRQVAVYPINNYAQLPITPVQGSDGEPLLIQIELPGRLLYVRIWEMKVGRISLYLMDTDTERNSESDRKITARLYEANREIRLLQEIVLGMCGVRFIRAMNIEASVYHMNEGHSAFLVLERLQECVRGGMSYEEAKVRVRSNTIFTTHTPVPAGNEAFSVDLMSRFFSNYPQTIGIDWQQFVQLGQMEGGNPHNFEMTVLALRFSSFANGVSRLHGEVSRHMWNRLWKSVPLAETPIGYVTNGVHTPSYVGEQMNELLTQYLGPNWLQAKPADPIWNKVDEIPDDTYWATRMTQKEELLDALRASLPAFAQKFHLGRAERMKMESMLKPNTLLIGFARRFAPYKRATLLFADPDRLARILNDPQRPCAFVFAGKSHPADEAGIDILQEVIRMARDPRFIGKIFFMENYSIAVSRMLSQGCDEWLNTPRRPHEASGTSGMKLPVNGGINLSISDGWWCEGYNRQNGWTIGPVVTMELPRDDQNDYDDAEALYTLLENAVLPLYHEMNAQDLPGNWIAMSKRSLKSLTAMYSSNRMVQDYCVEAYEPAARRREVLAANDWALCKELANWEQNLPARFGTIKMEEIILSGGDGNTMFCGEPLNVRLHMHLGQMNEDEVLVQLVIGRTYANGNFRGVPDHLRLEPKQTKEDGGDGRTYSATYIPKYNGPYRFGVRVMPTHKGLASPLDTGLVLWG